ncbi:hypothetical protein HHI36_012985 [Cryptolaemus montrouzieri]|uniref:Uncharacterized protein n=1 Tax=Cryptolaemus montrouzieri TaxID=559131 RepID=A0ABD2NGG7_9CUCU
MQVQKKSNLNLVLKRSVDNAKSIADRIANDSSLVNVGARYHEDCSKRLYSKKWGDETRHDELKNNIDNVMQDIFAYLHENSEECQFRLTDLIKSLKGDYIPEKRTVIEQLKAKYRDDTVRLQCNAKLYQKDHVIKKIILEDRNCRTSEISVRGSMK